MPKSAAVVDAGDRVAVRWGMVGWVSICIPVVCSSFAIAAPAFEKIARQPLPTEAHQRAAAWLPWQVAGWGTADAGI